MNDAPTKEWLLTELGWCGCWDSHPLVTLREYLRFRNAKEDDKERWLLAEDKHVAGLAYLLEGTCDRIGLTEHGVSSRYSWLTDKGRAVLGMLDAVDDFETWAEEWEEAK